MGKFSGVLICTDLDGTLACGSQICEENCRAIAYFQSEGGRFTFATGRPAGYEKNLSVTPNAPLITENGTRIYDPVSGRTLWTFPLDGCGLLLEWLDAATSFRLVSLCFTDGIVRATPGNVVESVFAHTTGDLLKIVCSEFEDSSVEKAVAFRDASHARFGDRYQVHRSWATGVEFISPLGGKGACAVMLRSLLEEEIHTLVGIGDYENDLTLLTRADQSFAPANACEAVLAKAQKVLCDYKEGAVAQMIDLLDKEFSQEGV